MSLLAALGLPNIPRITRKAKAENPELSGAYVHENPAMLAESDQFLAAMQDSPRRRGDGNL